MTTHEEPDTVFPMYMDKIGSDQSPTNITDFRPLRQPLEDDEPEESGPDPKGSSAPEPAVDSALTPETPVTPSPETPVPEPAEKDSPDSRQVKPGTPSSSSSPSRGKTAPPAKG